MPASKKVATLFDDIANNMLQFFEGWDTHVPHEGEKGGLRERRVRDLLESYLPGKYGVGTGHIIDKRGEVSLQEDIVIYDRLNGPILKVDPYYQVFPCESVYATVEVKSRLTKSEIKKCIAHTCQLRKLDRSDHRGNLGHIQTFVFAYDSYGKSSEHQAVWARNKFRELALAENEQKHIPSAVLCLKHKFVLRQDTDQTNYVTYTFTSGALLYFFTTLLHRISLAKVTSPLLFDHYGWIQNIMTEYDIDGNAIPIIGLGVGKLVRSDRT